MERWKVASTILLGATVGVATHAKAQSIEVVSIADDESAANGDAFTFAVSDDGNIVVFDSAADNLVVGDVNFVYDVFVRDRSAGTTRRVSVSSSGAEGNSTSYKAMLSADGSTVAFQSYATNLVAADGNGVADAFVHELASGATTRVSVDSAGVEGNGESDAPVVSADGRYVAFHSSATNLVSGDTNGKKDVFLRDRVAGKTSRVSVDSSGGQLDGDAILPAISRDGRYVLFHTLAKTLDPIDTDSRFDVYLHDTASGTTTLVSLDSSGTKGNDHSWAVDVSDDGRYAAFMSYATNLVANDGSGSRDLFVRDLRAGLTVCASVDSDGILPGGGAILDGASMSGDARFVFFSAGADGLVPGDANGQMDVFAREMFAGVTTRLSVAWDGSAPNDGSQWVRSSIDGGFAVFGSYATNLVPGGTTGKQAFLRERPTYFAWTRNYGTGYPGTNGFPTLTASVPPTLHRDVDLLFSNSLGAPTVGLVFLGTQAVQWPTGWGGDLLVDPTWTFLLPIPAGGGVLSGTVPVDELLLGLVLYAQVLEFDPGATDDISFTDGLELGFGY